MFLRQCFSKSLLRLGAPFGPVLSSRASPPGFQCVASRLDLRITGYLRILNCRFLCSQVRPSYGSLPQYCDVTFRTVSQLLRGALVEVRFRDRLVRNDCLPGSHLQSPSDHPPANGNGNLSAPGNSPCMAGVDDLQV